MCGQDKETPLLPGRECLPPATTTPNPWPELRRVWASLPLHPEPRAPSSSPQPSISCPPLCTPSSKGSSSPVSLSLWLPSTLDVASNKCLRHPWFARGSVSKDRASNYSGNNLFLLAGGITTDGCELSPLNPNMIHDV